MKIEFTFDNITQLEELYYAVEHIPEEILDDAEELGTPDKEDQALYDVILKLKEKLIEVKSKRVPEVNLKMGCSSCMLDNLLLDHLYSGHQHNH